MKGTTVESSDSGIQMIDLTFRCLSSQPCRALIAAVCCVTQNSSISTGVKIDLTCSGLYGLATERMKL